MELKISVLSEPGGRAVNEDAYGFWTGNNTCFCVLSDGVGGHHGGDIASRLAVRAVLEWLRQTPVCSAESISVALQAANNAIVDEQRRSPSCSRMRATILVLAIDTGQASAIWGHIGDTRLYCFRRQRIISQTRDHSVLQSMVDAGYLQAKDLRDSPQRNALLAALGDTETFEPCIASSTLPLQDGDIFLLCTDGLWEYVDEAEMEQALATAASPEAWLRQLEHKVLERGRPGQDNYSALVVSCKDADVTRQL